MKRSDAQSDINTTDYWNSIYAREGETGRVRVDEGRMEQIYRWVEVRHKELGRPVNLLDAGCGLGEVEEAMAKWVNAFGLDISNEAIRHAVRKAKTPENYVVGKVEKIPWETRRFDVVWCGETLEHLDDPLSAVSELFRVAGDQGLVIVSVPYRGRNRDKEHIWEFTPADVVEWGSKFRGELLFLDCYILPGWETLLAVFRNDPDGKIT